MGKSSQIIGRKFGRLTVVERAEDLIAKNGKRRSQWLCKCDCGNTAIARRDALVSGRKQSCGCLKKEMPIKHGLLNTRLYYVWLSMKKRCYLPSNSDYNGYGARGVSICDEWRNSFEAFHEWALANGYDETAPRGQCTIERIDNNGNYEPSNCRWTTNDEQQNNKRSNHYITYNGKTQTIAQWAREIGVSRATLSNRINRLQWTIEKALTYR